MSIDNIKKAEEKNIIQIKNLMENMINKYDNEITVRQTRINNFVENFIQFINNHKIFKDKMDNLQKKTNIENKSIKSYCKYQIKLFNNIIVKHIFDDKTTNDYRFHILEKEENLTRELFCEKKLTDTLYSITISGLGRLEYLFKSEYISIIENLEKYLFQIKEEFELMYQNYEFEYYTLIYNQYKYNFEQLNK